MAATARPATPVIRPATAGPLHFVWKLLTNVKFALLLVGLALVASLLGVVLPQIPTTMSGNPAAVSAWIALRQQDFGLLTSPMNRLGLFQIFYTPWYDGLWVLIIIAVTVCTVSRFLPTWRSVHRPPRTVSDAYFERAHHRATFTQPGGAEAVESLLRKRHYAVERTQTAPDGTVYLFAQRFSWSQYGTFLSHLALLLLLVGALLTRFAGFNNVFVLGDNTPAVPVFATPGPSQIFVKMLDAVRRTDSQGTVIDFHSVLEVRRGNQIVHCVATVNTPCKAFGYNINQASYYNDIASLRIWDPSGRLIYADPVDFQGQTTPVPAIRVTDAAGHVLYNQELPQMGSSTNGSNVVASAVLTFPRTVGAAGSLEAYGATWAVENGKLRLTLSSLTGTILGHPGLAPGESVKSGPYTISYVGGRSIPAITVTSMPGTASPVTLQMPRDANGKTYLFMSGVEPGNLVVHQGSPARATTGYTFAYGGLVDASGVSIKRDPGSTFVFIAVVMALIGLAITFYIPRRRLWVRISGSRTSFAGVAERTTRFARELRIMGSELGSLDALRPGDLDPEA